jgi:hypothetical protein
MRRISAIFIAACVVLIAASAGAVLYLGFGVDASTDWNGVVQFCQQSFA